MNYAEYLRKMLMPLRLYNLGDGTVVSAETEAAGGGMDQLAALLSDIERDAQPATASSEGLDRWESLLPHRPPETIDARRRAVSALMSTTDSSFTRSALAASLAACGLNVEVRELGGGKIEVSFPDVGGIPKDFDRITATLELLLPCHLITEFRFNYMTWERFEMVFGDWNRFDHPAKTWDEIELTWK